MDASQPKDVEVASGTEPGDMDELREALIALTRNTDELVSAVSQLVGALKTLSES